MRHKTIRTLDHNAQSIINKRSLSDIRLFAHEKMSKQLNSATSSSGNIRLKLTLEKLGCDATVQPLQNQVQRLHKKKGMEAPKSQ